MNLEKHVLIVAAGQGKRIAGNIPKQFLFLNGKPMLFYTFNSFLFLKHIKFTLVLNPAYIDSWKELCNSNGFNIPHTIAEGGPTRFHSVKSGLKSIPPDSLVLIHDAARPFVSEETIANTIKMATRKGNAVPAIEIVDSIREINASYNKSINRNNLRAIQTPQVFHLDKIKEAYNQPYDENFTDDASVLESIGEKINIVEGNIENIKISNQFDLAIAESILDYTKD